MSLMKLVISIFNIVASHNTYPKKSIVAFSYQDGQIDEIH